MFEELKPRNLGFYVDAEDQAQKLVHDHVKALEDEISGKDQIITKLYIMCIDLFTIAKLAELDDITATILHNTERQLKDLFK